MAGLSSMSISEKRRGCGVLKAGLFVKVKVGFRNAGPVLVLCRFGLKRDLEGALGMDCLSGLVCLGALTVCLEALNGFGAELREDAEDDDGGCAVRSGQCGQLAVRQALQAGLATTGGMETEVETNLCCCVGVAEQRDWLHRPHHDRCRTATPCGQGVLVAPSR